MYTSNLFKRWTYKFFAPDLLQRGTYEAFKRLLEDDRRCHELIADFQDLFFKKEPTEWTQVIALYERLSEAVGAVVNELSLISGRNATDLSAYYKKFDSYIRFLLQPESHPAEPPYTVCMGDPRIKTQLAGNKGKNLTEIYQNFDCSVPAGFIVTTNSWNVLVEYSKLRPEINSHLLALDPENIQSLHTISETLVSLIMGAKIPPEVDRAIIKASRELIDGLGSKEKTRFAVRSSAANEDGRNSFAGQYKSILDVDPLYIHDSYLQVLASKYSPKALLYRITAGISDSEASMAVLIVEMIQAKAAGVIYTTDPDGKEPDTLFIHSVSGGGEKLVSGIAQPSLNRFNKKNPTAESAQDPNSPINLNEARELARLAIDLETYFGTPQDIEWVIKDSDPIILQSRPLRASPAVKNDNSSKRDSSRDLPLLYHGGITAARGSGSGPAYFLSTDQAPTHPPTGAVLIVETIPPSLILFLPRCSGVISVRGSTASHFSTICRELEIPLIVAAAGIKQKISPGEQLTVDADYQNVYQGKDESCIPLSGASPNRENRPYFRRIRTILDFITPLNILDPEANSFSPESCRSLHDIVRFAHETGVRAMFAIGKSGSRRRYRKQLITALPFDLYLINVDNNSRNSQTSDDTVSIDQVDSTPFQALWQGISHPSITWGEHVYYNWKEYDSAAMTDGFAFKDKTESASYAVCGHDYLNLNIRFGYHFTVVDTLCSENSAQNYCLIRFAGGGGTAEGRYFRLKYLEEILRRIGFQVTSKTDLLDARLEALPVDQMTQRLFTLGRMLGTSKLMDMVLKDDESVATHLELFFDCKDSFMQQEPSL